MYLIKLNEGVRKRFIKSGIIAIYVLPFAITAILIANVYFRKRRTSGPAREYRDQTVLPLPLNPVLPVTDSVKNNGENPQAALQNESSAIFPVQEIPEQTNQTAIGQKEPVAQLLIKFTTDESCKLKITNMDLDEVINWDLSRSENGTIYLKPGKYSIVATSMTDSSKSITYPFDVKPGDTHTTKSLHIRF